MACDHAQATRVTKLITWCRQCGALHHHKNARWYLPRAPVASVPSTCGYSGFLSEGNGCFLASGHAGDHYDENGRL